MWSIFFLTLGLLILAFAGIAIKMFVLKNGKFVKTCARIEFEDGETVGCVCKSKTGKHEDCPNYELHHGKAALKLKENDTKN
ncbi:MAG: hypothetical protein RRY15_01675 [Bacteroidales bacterium]